MKNNILAMLLVAVVAALTGARAQADTDWSSDEYDLYSGDFDGDGADDILYVAKDPSKASGIARSDGTGPNIPWQSWLSNYLGIPWHSNLYRVIVADFNGDHRSDVFLQRNTPGDHYLLLANDNGKLTAINQTIANQYLGYAWSGDEHRAAAGDFDGDGRADLFLQGTHRDSTHFIVAADSNGQFVSGPLQWWTDASWGAFKWSTQNSNIFVGDFNGDGLSDLLIQARPNLVMIDFDVMIPVPTYTPNSFGVALSQGGTTPFQQVGIQQWSRNAYGVDWASQTSNIVIGDFDGDGTDDVLLQARSETHASYVVSGNTSGAIFGSGAALASNVSWSSSSYQLIVGDFDGSGGDGIYWQSTSSSGVNSLANTITGSSISQTTHNPTSSTGVVPASVTGHTVGSFAVSQAGAATYAIPITVPPGAAGAHPDLSISYQSSSGNGLLGMGWSLGGLSEIGRCGKTRVQDGANAGVELSTADRFCLDGNKLRLTGGTYGASGSTYQTELQTFARITAQGTAGNGPAYFVVESKNGRTYEYGSSTDSRIEAVNSAAASTPHTWALNKVTDAHGNTMTISYQEDGAPNGSFRPSEILYTSNTNAGLDAAYKVVFVWASRSTNDILTSYVAGGVMKETMRLDRVETQYNDPGTGWRLVRKYQLSYNTSGSTPRTRLAAVQECDRNDACLEPTTITWQDGDKGWVSTDTTSSSDSGALMEYSYALDIDGDGRDDLVYPQVVSGTARWHYMRSDGSGGFGAPVNTGVSAGNTTDLQYAYAQPIDYFSEGRMGLLVDAPGYSTRQILRWNGSGLGLTNTNLSVELDGEEWIADFDGDGHSDLLYSTYASGTGTFYVHRNSGATSGTAQFDTATSFYSVNVTGSLNVFSSGIGSSFLNRILDFNGDGRADIMYSTTTSACSSGPSCIYTTTWYALASTGTSFVQSQSWTCTRTGVSCSSIPLAGDYNGDGLTDLVLEVTDWRIMFGSGAGLTTSSTISAPSDFVSTGFTEDYDRDGNADLFYAPSSSSGSWYVLRSTGTDFETPVEIALPSSSANDTIRVLDVDGDGLRDLGYQNSDYRIRKHKGKIPDLLAAIADGFGNRVDVQYAPLTDASVYTRGTGATFPVMDIQAAMHVVKSYSPSDGTGGSYTVTQKYAGLRLHLQGRGLLGFASRESVDDRTHAKNTWTLRQDFPFIGWVSDSATYQQSGSLVAHVENEQDELVVQANTDQERRFPYTKVSTKTSYEVGGSSDGQPIASVTRTTAVDNDGNPTTISTVTADLTGSGLTYTTSTTNSYEDSTCAWRGFATKQEVTNTVPVFGAQTRTVQFIRDTSNATACRVYQQIVEPNGADDVKVTTTFGYDTFGHSASQTVSAANIQSRTTSTNFGTQGVFPVSVTASVTSTFSQSASKTYDYALGVPKTATDANGLVTSFDYDGFGGMVRQTRPDGTKSEWTYASCSVTNGYCGDNRLRYQVTKSELDASGNVIHAATQRFDALGRALYDESQTLSGAFSVIATGYDNQGRISKRSQPYFSGFAAYFTTFTYDLISRLTQEERQTSEGATGTQTTKYGYDGLLNTLEDANGGISTKQMNALGQVVEVTDAASGVTTYAYDPFGNLKETTDPAGNKIVNGFNILGLKISSDDRDMGHWTYTYYPTGELWTQTDAKNQTVTFTYDQLSRPKTRIEPEGTTTYIYGESSAAKNIGKLESVSSPGSYSESFTYDSLGRLQQTTTSADATSFAVTNAYSATTGLLESVTYPTSTSAVTGSRFKVQYEYEHGLLKRTRDFNSPSTVYWEQVETNAAGQTIDEVYGNGVRTYSAYDGITGLLGERTAGSSSQIQNLGYQWDKLGNLLQRKDNANNLTEDFDYDGLNRLKTSKLNNVQNLSLTYYANGNIWTKSDVGTYTYPTPGASSVRPHAVTTAGSNSYGYDANGNMTTRNGSSITWYSYNKPNRIDSGNNFSQFYYGADRSRYKQVAYTAAGGDLPSGTETTIYVGGLFEKVTKPSGVIEYKHYVLAGGEAIAIRTLRTNNADDTRYLHKDHLGSVDTITDEAGAVVQRLSYDAFGKRRNASTWAGVPGSSDWSNIAAITHRAFTFHEQLDNLDLVHMNGRVYDPNLGRFISADPYVQAPLMSQSLNRYSYVMNNPLSLIDPSGYSWLSKLYKKAGAWFDKAFGIIGQIVASVIVVAIAVAACWSSQGTGCEPAIATAAAQLAMIWGRSGTGGMTPATGPPLSVGTRSGSSVGDWVRDHGITSNALDATAGGDTSSAWSVPAGEMFNWFAGFGDGMLFDLTRYAREAMGLGSIDTESAYYKAGHITGLVAGILATAGTGTPEYLSVSGGRAATPMVGMLDVDLAAQVARGATRGVSVLGHASDGYVYLARTLGARYFEVPMKVWDAMTPAQQWAANAKFLDDLIARSDTVVLATQASAARAGSFFARELEYLFARGYTLAEDGMRMVPPGL